MGKGSKNEPSLHAFARMNFLYQASILTSDKSPLTNYYGKLVRDISKKTVEKVHPDVKRSLCKACSFPMLCRPNGLDAKVKPRKKRKSKKRLKKSNDDKTTRTGVIKSYVEKKYEKSRIDQRNKSPNKLTWICNCCGFSMCMLQKPDHKLWMNEEASKL